jgi:hypothetical protein
MARSNTITLLPLDEWARIMSVPAWAFNQVVWNDGASARSQRDVCPTVYVQNGFWGDPNIIVGRDEVAQAIAVAEEMVAEMLGFWPARKYICGERITWPMPARGSQMHSPVLETRKGHVQEFGIESWELVCENVAVEYSDEDEDGVLERATVTCPSINLYDLYDLYYDDMLVDLDACDLVVVPNGYDPAHYSIRPLNIAVDGDTAVATITGWRWQFVQPRFWLDVSEIPIMDDVYFIHGDDLYGFEGVDVWKRYTDPRKQAQLVWDTGPCDAYACRETCQDACAQVQDNEMGMFKVTPAQWDASNEQWLRKRGACSGTPRFVRVWYVSGYNNNRCYECSSMGPRMKEAIVRLSNCFLPEAPCGCSITRERWEKDREEMPIDSMDVELAQTTFGTTMRGAVWAYTVFKSIPPLGQGG